MPEKTPTDHKKPDDGSYPFTVKGKKYRLPKIGEEAALAVPAGVTQDAMMYPEDETKQIALGLHLLHCVGADPKALAALRTLTTGEMLEIVGSWMGEASGSSD